MVEQPRKKRIAVHIGLPKTGTTFFQDTLAHNNNSLKENGISVFLRDDIEAFVERTQEKLLGGEPLGEHDILHFGACAKDENLIISDERLAGEVGYWNNTTEVIYSDIHFWAKEICDQFQEADLCFFISLRSYADAFDSGYIQCLKMGIDISVQKFKSRLEDLDVSWVRVIKDLADTIAPSKLVVVEFGENVNSVLIEEMENHLGSLNLMEHPNPRENKRYGDLSIQIAQLANPILNPQGRKMLRRILENQVVSDTETSFSLFSVEESVILDERFKRDMKEIEKSAQNRLKVRLQES